MSRYVTIREASDDQVRIKIAPTALTRGHLGVIKLEGLVTLLHICRNVSTKRHRSTKRRLMEQTGFPELVVQRAIRNLKGIGSIAHMKKKYAIPAIRGSAVEMALWEYRLATNLTWEQLQLWSAVKLEEGIPAGAGTLEAKTLMTRTKAFATLHDPSENGLQAMFLVNIEGGRLYTPSHFRDDPR